MKIESKLNYQGKDLELVYEDVETFDSIPRDLCTQIYGFCFCDEELLLVFEGDRQAWGPVGGTPEPGETFEETLKREILEESNMEVLKWLPIGYQRVTEPTGQVIYQLRAVCQVRPFGPFVKDPAGDVEAIKLINPADYKQYFDWGEVGARIMERALELKEKL